ncbi:ATP-dependent Lon protease pim1 [Clydaea vesicula]|uniref:Lon protease homolog, mitochondrial n=1 Tax=Clydaea vesicula TaxID=447962 RepID=A0AAD5TX75_9FUNG|nr:ATP-dependent Lon protease pim1 [Clydaea vesicula]
MYFPNYSRRRQKQLKRLKTIEKLEKEIKKKKGSVEEKKVDNVNFNEDPNDQENIFNAKPTTSELTAKSVPKEYPQLLCVPIHGRPLFPGFFKTIFLEDPDVIKSVQNLVKKNQPYMGVFLNRVKEEDSNKDEKTGDKILSDDQVYHTGVFCEIISTHVTGLNQNRLSVVLFPYRRIKFNKLINLNQVSLKSTKKVDVSSSNFNLASGSAIASDEVSVEKDTSTNVVSEYNEDILPINAHLSSLSVSLVNVENLEDLKIQNREYVRAASTEILNVLKEMSQINVLVRDHIVAFSISTGGDAFTDPARFSDFVSAICHGDPTELQEIVETLSIDERVTKALTVIKKELENFKLGNKIVSNVEERIGKKNQEYFLMEQMKTIKKELGIDGDGKDRLIFKFKKRAATLNMPAEEILKLSTLEPAAAEYNVTRNYLEWITSIPWGKSSTENFDISRAKKILDEDHFGLKDVKDRILEFIAVGKLRKSIEGKIICFVGPPGVGKTSIGKSIAKSLGREFYRFSVGGLNDVAEIKGHRRTYVGAMPGKVIQAMKKVQTENPLIMIDEIDKLGKGHQGDPASALLELLDPEQNNNFLDHYMDLPMDLSKVLFVCTANTIDTIPAPLLDRMEVITLSGYIAEEKLEIAKKYLTPAAKIQSGLEQNSNVILTEEALNSIIKYWCRESGVRNLKKQIEKVFRKAALKLVKFEQGYDTALIDNANNANDAKAAEFDAATNENVTGQCKIEITSENLKDYIGSPNFTSERMYETTPPGVVMGLAWSSMGGTPLYTESILEAPITESSKPNFNRTGQLGEVMKESSVISYSFAKSLMTRKYPENKFFEKASIHLHVPEGATPKDGPSAGVTMTTSLLSLALNTSVSSDVAMTGELTLTGKVLKIGGLKEKCIAAKQSGIKKIFMPKSNKPDWEEIPDYIRNGLTPHFVEWYDEIFNAIFSLDKQ